MKTEETEIVTTLHPFEGLPDGEVRLKKCELVRQINGLITKHGISEREAVNRGIFDPIDFDAILTGIIHRFSVKQLKKKIKVISLLFEDEHV